MVASMASAEAINPTIADAAFIGAEVESPPAAPRSDIFGELPLTGCVVAVTADRRRGDLSALLARRGARVVETPIHRLVPIDDDLRQLGDGLGVRRLIEAIIRREVHAVAFTSSPGVTALLEAADAAGVPTQLVAALRGDVAALCVGPACARPLQALDIKALWPERSRLGAMVATLCVALPPRIRREVPVGMGRTLVLQGFAAVIDGDPVLLPPLPAAVLTELARRPGWVISRAELLRRVWSPRGAGAAGRDEHAVEATIARLRVALGPNADLIKTVTKRGYRLATVEAGR
jgi:uroporphyrinogen-III synthase